MRAQAESGPEKGSGTSREFWTEDVVSGVWGTIVSHRISIPSTRDRGVKKES